MRKSKLRFWGFLAPSLIAFCIVVIIPTCIGFFYSLTNWNGIVGSDVKFVGFQNPKSFYEKASILLLTSDYEGFPLTITESMNFGVIPIVYGSYSAAYDIISDNYSGMISKPNNGFDEEDFTNKLKMLLSSVTKRKDFSLNALNDSRRFLLNNIYEKWEKIL